MNNQKIAAIVPAFNEEKNVGNVLDVLLNSKEFDEIILVDDGSEDHTSQIGKRLGVKVVTLKNNIGKTNAMRVGVKNTDANLVVFFDADLIGLSKEHILALIEPVLKNEATMCVGVRDRWWGLPKLIANIFPFMLAIGGERAIKPFVLNDIPEKLISNMTDTMIMNYYCKINNLPVKYVDLKKLDIIVKEKKWGLVKGLLARINMIVEFIKMKIIISFNKHEFIQKNSFKK